MPGAAAQEHRAIGEADPDRQATGCAPDSPDGNPALDELAQPRAQEDVALVGMRRGDPLERLVQALDPQGVRLAIDRASSAIPEPAASWPSGRAMRRRGRPQAKRDRAHGTHGQGEEEQSCVHETSVRAVKQPRHVSRAVETLAFPRRLARRRRVSPG